MSERASATFDLPSGPSAPLRCSACANRACEALGSVPGVARVDCDAAGAAVRVEYDPGRVSEADLAAEMEQFGLELAESVHHAAWRVSGLD
jgi:copper chaperone CopZ